MTEPPPGTEGVRTLRHEYETRGLDVSDLAPDPLAQFARWYEDAAAEGIYEPHAMTLSTAGPDGRPVSRYVLLRGMDDRGFQFFTSYRSAKARDLDARREAALTWGWLELHRQVRARGTVTRLPAAESDAYFESRPRGSQIAAWASPQSEVIAGREELERRVAEVEARFEGRPVPRPEHWGGYLLEPADVEFWQGRKSRLHDRLRYRRSGGAWIVERLAP
ncbi:MAG: pyridoxamine 5-phosphate oxidase [Solirubrobacteraceae bacterium]|nr:pyridoxamine 5-phosphate oxidase [Solirubrobacteraceae bacterium]